MIKFFIYIFLFVFACFMAFACGFHSSDDDRIPPEIHELNLMYEMGAIIAPDTFYLSSSNNAFQIRMTDDSGLSSYFIEIYYTEGPRNDSLPLHIKSAWADSFNQKDFSVKRFITLDSRQTDSTNTSITKPVIPGEYNFKLKVVDLSGNADSLTKKVQVLYPVLSPDEE